LPIYVQRADRVLANDNVDARIAGPDQDLGRSNGGNADRDRTGEGGRLGSLADIHVNPPLTCL
jgi:hypothetical protein